MSGIFGPIREYEGCGCGHKPSMCHKVNAAAWCGAETPNVELRNALIACAEAAGEDMSGGVPTWPALHVWAVRAVRQLRADYDNAAEDMADAAIIRERLASDDGTRISLDELLDAHGFSRADLEAAIAEEDHVSPTAASQSSPDSAVCLRCRESDSGQT